MDIQIWPMTMPFIDKSKEEGRMWESQIGPQGAPVLWKLLFFSPLFKCHVQLVDAWKERQGSHTEGHASQHPSLSAFPPRCPRAQASGCVAMTTKWGKWLQEDPHHDQHSHRTEWCTNLVCARLILHAILQPMLLFGIIKLFFAHCSLVCAITLPSSANTVHPEAEVWIRSVTLWLLQKCSRVQIRQDMKIEHAENKWGEMTQSRKYEGWNTKLLQTKRQLFRLSKEDDAAKTIKHERFVEFIADCPNTCLNEGDVCTGTGRIIVMQADGIWIFNFYNTFSKNSAFICIPAVW